MQLKIGEHFIHIVSDSVSLMDFFDKNYMPVPDSYDSHPDLFIHIVEGYGVPFTDYKVHIMKETKKTIFRRADYFIEVDSGYRTATIHVHDELALKHALTNLYSSFIVHKNWGLLIHSSCVADNGRAHLFAGYSGAGKSTAAVLSLPREILSDEATLVKISPDEITVYNSPFRSELDATPAVGQIPLESIHILIQADAHNRTVMTKSNGLLALMDKVFFWTSSPEETKTILAMLKTLIDSVPVYKLYFQRNPAFWELISS